MGNGAGVGDNDTLKTSCFNTLWEMEPTDVQRLIKLMNCFNTLWEMEPLGYPNKGTA